MSTFPLLTNLDELADAITASKQQPVLLFKHSTQCPISAGALAELEQFHAIGADVPIYMVHVIEDRPVSNEIAERFAIKHESPQAFWLSEGGVQWHASHRAITAQALAETKP
jgi:bacillithiol system protein YtxJ